MGRLDSAGPFFILFPRTQKKTNSHQKEPLQSPAVDRAGNAYILRREE